MNAPAPTAHPFAFTHSRAFTFAHARSDYRQQPSLINLVPYDVDYVLSSGGWLIRASRRFILRRGVDTL
jgi:hypothetical protein